MSKLSAQTPSEIDEQLFPLWAERYKYATWAYDEKQRVAKTIFPKARVSHRSSYDVRPLNAYAFKTACETLAKYEAKLAEIAAEIAPFTAEFERRGGWQRYVLCMTRRAKGGHLHFQHCSTLRPTTECLIVSDASGLDSDQVVGKFGETACTKCFPDAPVDGSPNTKQGEEQVSKTVEETSSSKTPAPVTKSKTKPVAQKRAKSFTEQPSTRKEIDLDRAARRYNAKVQLVEDLKRQLEAARADVKTARIEVTKRSALVPNAEVIGHDVEADHVMLQVRFYETGAKS